MNPFLLELLLNIFFIFFLRFSLFLAFISRGFFVRIYVGIGRRNAPPGPAIGLPPNLEEGNWKSGPGSNVSDNQGNGGSGFQQNTPNSFGAPVFPNAGQGSPAGNSQQFQNAPPPGSNTPQYTGTCAIAKTRLLCELFFNFD